MRKTIEDIVKVVGIIAGLVAIASSQFRTEGIIAVIICASIVIAFRIEEEKKEQKLNDEKPTKLPSTEIEQKNDFPWNVPYRPNPNFTGRDEDMERLHQLLVGKDKVVINQVQGISGMGGVGKTQLAVEYCHKYKGEYPCGVLWVRAEKSVLEAYGMLSDELGLGLPERLEVRKQCAEVRRTLENIENPGLLVLDNLDEKNDYDLLKEYLPTTGQCHMLITSRRNDLIKGKGISLLRQSKKEFFTTKPGRDRYHIHLPVSRRGDPAGM